VEHIVNELGGALVPWGYVLIFVLTALEASAFIGLVIPGETALLLAGYLVYQGDLDLVTVCVVAIVGAIVGDSIGYEIGRRYGDRLKGTRVGGLVGHDRWDRARAFVRRHGPVSVLLGRWVGVLRAIVPAVVGDARMPYPSFLFWNVLGAVVWVPVVVGAGYLAGSSYQRVEHDLGQGGLVVVALLVVAAVGWLAARRVRRRRH